ncbi:hypothetical protein AAF712_002852 [Marasmius tenuissimus]|uniref:Uncharacterized protein n=1 Tax=Marasmius tenuissimus TaxID=585030 RepID=A0ABR3ABL3_9AGAR
MASNERGQNPLRLEFKLKVPIQQPSGVGQNGTSRLNSPFAPSTTPLTADALSRLQATYASEASVTSYPLSTLPEPPATTPLSKLSTSSGSSTTNPGDHSGSPAVSPRVHVLGRSHSRPSSRHEANYRPSLLKGKDQPFSPQNETPEQDISAIPPRPSNPVPPLETSPEFAPMNQVGIEDNYPLTPSNSTASESSSSYSMNSASDSDFYGQDSLHNLRELQIPRLSGLPALTPPVIAGFLSQQSALTNASQMTLTDGNTTGQDALPLTRRSSSGTVSRREARSDEPVPEIEALPPLPNVLQRQPSAVATPSSSNFTRGSRSPALPEPSRAGSRVTDSGGKNASRSAPSISQRTSSKGSTHRVPVPALEPESSPPMPNGTHQHVPVTPPAVSTASPILSVTEPVLRESLRRKMTGSSEQGTRSSPGSTPSISRSSSSRTSTRRATPVSELENPHPMPNGTLRQHAPVTPPPRRSATAHSAKDTRPGMSGEAKAARQDDSSSSGPSSSRTSSERSARNAGRSTPPVLEHENLPPKPDKSYRKKAVALSLQPDIHSRRSNERLPHNEPVSSDLDTMRQEAPASAMSRSFSRRSTRRAADPVQDQGFTGLPPLPNSSSRQPHLPMSTSKMTPSLEKPRSDSSQSSPSDTNPITCRFTSSKKSSQQEPISTKRATNGSHQERMPPTGGLILSLETPAFAGFSSGANGAYHYIDSPVTSSLTSRPLSRREFRDSEPKFDILSGSEPPLQSPSDSVKSFEEGGF